jgi:hypothetical protein
MEPSQEIFIEMKRAAISIWKDYDNKFGYATEKIKRINSIENVSDNAMVFYRMFDHWTKQLMESKLSEEAINYINSNK